MPQIWLGSIRNSLYFHLITFCAAFLYIWPIHYITFKSILIDMKEIQLNDNELNKIDRILVIDMQSI